MTTNQLRFGELRISGYVDSSLVKETDPHSEETSHSPLRVPLSTLKADSIITPLHKKDTQVSPRHVWKTRFS